MTTWVLRGGGTTAVWSLKPIQFQIGVKMKQVFGTPTCIPGQLKQKKTSEESCARYLLCIHTLTKLLKISPVYL